MFQALTTSNKLSSHKNHTRASIKSKYKQNPSFPYLENASQTTPTLKRMSTKVPEADLRAENPNTDGVRDYYKEH